MKVKNLYQYAPFPHFFCGECFFFKQLSTFIELSTVQFNNLVPGGGLTAHESAGGHTLARHLGLTETELAKRLTAQIALPRASSFTNRETAEQAISDAIDANQTQINNWLADTGTRLQIQYTAANSIGITLTRSATSTVPAQNLQIILRRDSTVPLGYYILTAYPPSMTKEQLPALAQLCSAYFHQDWDLEAPDALGVIRNYLKDESTSQVQQTIKEIEQLVSLNLEPEQLKNLLESDLNCYYNPTIYGISHHSWLLWVQLSLKQTVSREILRSA